MVGASILIAAVFVGVASSLMKLTTIAPTAASSSRGAEPTLATIPSPTVMAIAADPCHVGDVVYCALNPDVSEATIRLTICVSGWTAKVRPPVSYTEPLKLRQIAAEHLPGTASAYEEDHRLPLELGGSPSDPANLSPEAHPGSYTKDAAENEAKREVCAGADLRTVQAAFVSRWLGPYASYR